MHNSDKLYYKISEVCKITGLKPSVLRFWEKEFKQLRPSKIGSSHRLYTKKHIDLILQIKSLLYEEKLTIEGAKKRLSSNNNLKNNPDKEFIKKELQEILNLLKK
ncbi:transcriptional regulator, MerR family [Deferribacter desulfuricans SSM1]|uniref:Transcriptional regulator, MerR family n=1 Tax=Deferribacter desulfuricans (strain DSM 14783 / JCM 11476 / NBRC 101012 / SSM1) TaxID=639282 RepID=D3PDI8_DEFDS|nr:MerR family transcriptional regulator [Deferribacter desulfuricans]BAI80661.1 transcriptional regulator, MerR family [Deferribacter desulfuricans SSM1]